MLGSFIDVKPTATLICTCNAFHQLPRYGQSVTNTNLILAIGDQPHEITYNPYGPQRLGEITNAENRRVEG